jgi:predicted amidohydrolase YtcJ
VVLRAKSGHAAWVNCLALRLAPEPSPEEAAEALSQGLQAAHRAGLTCIHDMGGIDCFQGLQVLRNAGKLTLRVIKSIPLAHLDETIGVGLRPALGMTGCAPAG